VSGCVTPRSGVQELGLSGHLRSTEARNWERRKEESCSWCQRKEKKREKNPYALNAGSARKMRNKKKVQQERNKKKEVAKLRNGTGLIVY
jgi:hypothetical protein